MPVRILIFPARLPLFLSYHHKLTKAQNLKTKRVDKTTHKCRYALPNANIVQMRSMTKQPDRMTDTYPYAPVMHRSCMRLS